MREALLLVDIVRLTEQIGWALDHAHEKGVIHRDFKPAIMLLDEMGNGYLSDFGIVKVAETSAFLTGSGMVSTPTYMAPEMAEVGAITPLIDIYALGVTVFQMLSGRAPYEADTPMGILLAHLSKPIPDVRRFRPELPDEVQWVVERGLAKDPLERYKSAESWLLLSLAKSCIESLEKS